IVAAGPIANLAFAVFAFWAMFVVGKPDYLPNVGATTGLAAEAGIARGDRLLALDGEALPTWTQAQIALVRAALARRDVPLTIREADGDERTLLLPLSKIPEGHDERAALAAIGLSAWRPPIPAEIGRVREGSPAARAGIVAGDRIVAIGGDAIDGFEDIPPLLQELAADGAEVSFVVSRGGERREFRVQPEASTQADGSRRWLVGIEPVAQRFPPDTELRHGPLAAIPAAFAETWKMTTTTFEFLKWFLSFLALMSLSIGLLNLMPVPILDGGHLLYYLIEAIKGSPVSERVLAAGQYVGLVLLAGLMGLAFYNDIARLLS
ncbi:MAG: site-2 protease family protein, partial [Burkholderiales bacterium]|nr:site-2 protease family protein [Burkholderiales bacterium]